MTFAEFAAAADDLAGDRHHVVEVEMVISRYGDRAIACRVYVAGAGYTDKRRTPEAALDEMRNMLGVAQPPTHELIGEIPQTSEVPS